MGKNLKSKRGTVASWFDFIDDRTTYQKDCIKRLFKYVVLTWSFSLAPLPTTCHLVSRCLRLNHTPPYPRTARERIYYGVKCARTMGAYMTRELDSLHAYGFSTSSADRPANSEVSLARLAFGAQRNQANPGDSVHSFVLCVP